MKNLLLKISVWLLLPQWDRGVFWSAYKVAQMQIDAQSDTDYYGGTKHAIAYERIRTILKKMGYKEEDITGAVVHLAICLKYLLGR